MTLLIAMNRFRIRDVEEAEFERIWAQRDSHLMEVPGFVEFRQFGVVTLLYTTEYKVK